MIGNLSNSKFEQIKIQISELSYSEKIELNSFLSESTFDIPDEHKKILDSRLYELETNPSSFVDFDEFFEKL